LEGVHTERIASVQFGEEQLITAGWDGRVHRWALGPLSETVDPAELEETWGVTLAGVVAD
jgi:hypothetical protein